MNEFTFKRYVTILLSIGWSIINSSVRLYADDTVIYAASPNRVETVNLLQEELENYQTWCILNKLSVNILKTKVMVFTSAKQHPGTLDLTMNNSKLLVVNTYKYLGVILDSNLTFEKHISFIHQVVCFLMFESFLDS